MKILVTGSAGFIGFHLTKSLLERGDEVLGLDSINDYYDINLKYSRLSDCGLNSDDCSVYNNIVQSKSYKNYRFIRLNLEDKENLEKLFEQESFDKVCNLAAQAGVRYSLINPYAYIESNIMGFMNILENCRQYGCKNLVYASSSSVYGLNTKYPFSTEDSVDHPISLYAATKKSNELMAHTYSHLYNIPSSGLRFFTVYGPYGRPDMALFIFTKAIIEGREIEVFNNGDMYRSFTYIDDIVKGVVKVIDTIPKGDSEWDSNNPVVSSSSAPYKIFNIGSWKSVKLMDYIKEIELNLGKKAKIKFMEMQPGDVFKTEADCTGLQSFVGYSPKIEIQEGISKFIDWYKEYYKV